MMHDIQQLGYFPGYCGDPRYGFTQKFERRVVVSFDTIDTDPAADYRVLVQCEPPPIFIAFKNMVYEHQHKFDLILAYDPRLLLLPHSREFIPVGSWINDVGLEKTDQISFLMSSKIFTSAHRMRFQILREVEGKNKLGEFDFFMHRSPPSVPNKDQFFTNAKFHIACENHVMENMFTEKLLDCFKTLTVPIYYGCANIEKYFDTRGIFRFNTIEEFRHIIANITPDTYSVMLPYVMENYELSRKYWQHNVYQRIEQEIQAEFFTN
jgi:hypothetical protein